MAIVHQYVLALMKHKHQLTTIVIADHNSMVTKFEAAMAKLAVLGHNTRTLVDCSEVIPVPAAAKVGAAVLPAGKSRADVQAACAATPFPTLQTAPGPATSIAPV